MIKEQFVSLLENSIKEEDILKNPGKGTSIIKEIKDDRVYYIRGKSTMNIKYDDMYDAYNMFKGKNCSTVDMKEYRPEIFDSRSNGHNCHITLIFMILIKMGLVEQIDGKGVRNNPFYCKIK